MYKNHKSCSIKYCTVCNVELIVGENWTEKRKKVHVNKCSICYNKKRMIYFENKDNKFLENYRINTNISHRKATWKLKLEIINAYGGKCECCGETNIEFLTIDHINGNGKEHRNEIKKESGIDLYRWLRKNNFPTDNFRLLCMNCNFSLGKYGYCPHNKEK